MVFTLSADGKPITSPTIIRQENSAKIVEFDTAEGEKLTARYEVTPESYGTFTAKGTIDGKEETSNAVKLEKSTITNQAGTPDPQSDDDSPAEIEVGELDRPFAYLTFFFLVLPVTVAAGWAVWSVVSRVLLPDAGAQIPDDVMLDGTYGQRVATIVLIIAAGFGGIVLTIGAWLAAIETRGRLRARLRGGPSTKGADTGVGAAELEKIPGILREARRLRGTISVIIAGSLILALAVWGVNALTGSAPSPDPTVTVTVGPSPSSGR